MSIVQFYRTDNNISADEKNAPPNVTRNRDLVQRCWKIVSSLDPNLDAFTHYPLHAVQRRHQLIARHLTIFNTMQTTKSRILRIPFDCHEIIYATGNASMQYSTPSLITKSPSRVSENLDTHLGHIRLALLLQSTYQPKSSTTTLLSPNQTPYIFGR